MNMKSLKGMGVALITPFKANGSIDVNALIELVQFQLKNGTDYIVVLGTTGEYPTLTAEERTVVKETVVAENDGHLPLVLGIGGNNTKEVGERLQTEDCSDFDAILSVSPYYNKPSQEGIYQHFKVVAENSPLPVLMYNVPGRTGSNMAPETVLRLAKDFNNIIGVKEAAGDMVQAMQMIDRAPEGFHVISGEDMLALPMVLAGGAGVISVIGQGFPKEFSEMIELGLKRQTDDAFALHYQLAPAIELVFAEGNPAGIKAVFHKLGLAEAQVRLPLMKASEDLQKKIDAFVDKLYG